MVACEHLNVVSQVLRCVGPFFFKCQSQVGVQTITFLRLRLKLHQISCPQLNVLYEVSVYLAGMSSTFV